MNPPYLQNRVKNALLSVKLEEDSGIVFDVLGHVKYYTGVLLHAVIGPSQENTNGLQTVQ